MPTDLELALQAGGKITEKTDLQKALEVGGKITSGMALHPPESQALPTEQTEDERGFLGRVGEKLGERVSSISEEISRTPEAIDIGLPVEKGMRVAGQVAGGIGDIIGEAVSSLYKGVMPESWQESIKSGISTTLSTEAGQKGLEALRSGTETYQAFKTRFPDTAKDIEAAFNIGSLIPIGKVGAVAGKEAIGVTKDIARMRVTAKGLDNQLIKTVKSNMPAIVKKGNIKGSIDLFDKQSTRGVTSIIKNKDKIKYIDADGNIYRQGIPETAEEALSAIEQNKREIFRQYSAAQTLAQESTPSLSTKPIIQGLNQLKRKSFIQRDSAILKSIDDNIEFFKEKGSMLLKEMEEEIANINARTAAFQRNPNPNLINNQAIDVLIADRMRKSLGDTIEKITDVGYAELKKDYGAMKVMEKGFLDAVKRNRVKGPGHMADLSDVLTGGTAIYAWSNLNAPLIAATMGAKFLKTFHNWRIGANRLTKKMFREADKIISKKETLKLPPQSRLFQALKGKPKVTPEVLPPELPRRIGLRQPGLIEYKPEVLPPELPRRIGLRQPGLIEYKPEVLPPTRGVPIKKPSTFGEPSIIKQKRVLTGDPFIDEKINIAMRIPPSLREAEQKLIIDLIVGR